MAIYRYDKKLGRLVLSNVTSPTPTPPPVYSTPAPKITKPVVNQFQSTQPKMQSAVQTQMKPNTFMQGNLINKAFDLLRAPEYALAGFGKGMSEEALRQGGVKGKPQLDFNPKNVINRFVSGVKGVIPGIQQRTEFSSTPGNYNQGERFGLKGGGAEAMNIFSTFNAPVLPIGKLAGVLKKVPGVEKGLGFVSRAVEKVGAEAKKIPLIYNTVEKFNPYFRNPEVGKMISDTEKATQGRVQQLYKQLKTASQNLSPAEQTRIGQILEGSITLNKKFEAIAKPFIKLATEIGDEAVKTGLLNPESYQKYKGQYMTHIFNEATKTGENIFSTLKRVTPKISGDFFKKRTGSVDYIRQFAPALFKGLGTELKDIESAKLYKRIADTFGKTLDETPEGFKVAKDFIKNEGIKRIVGDVSLPAEVIDYINRTVEIKKTSKLLDLWKQIKTIYNPAYHLRNLASNQILTDMQTGEGLQKTVADYMGVIKNYFGKGDTRFANAAEKGGLIKNPNFYQGVEEFMKNAGVGLSGEKQSLLSKAKDFIVDFPRKLQLGSEETAKLNVFTTLAKKEAQRSGRDVNEVLQDSNFLKTVINKAEEAIFSPYNISKAERESVKNIIPFYSFTRQALPFFIKTLINHPERLAKYPRFKDVIENMSPEDKVSENIMPENVKGLIRTPNKTESGKNVYIDPTYIYPWGNFSSEGFLNKGQLPFGLSLNPFYQELFSQLANYDSYYGQPIAQSNLPWENIKERLTHARRTFSPAFLNTLVDKIIPAFTGKPDYVGQERSKVQSLLDTVGVKTKTYSSQELRSKGGKENEAGLRSIQKEFQSINERQDMPADTKQKYIESLMRLYRKKLQEAR